MWFVIAGIAAAIVAYRWRSLAIPVLATFVLVSASIGGFLLYTSSVDQVVNEQVVVAPPAPAPAADAPVAPAAPADQNAAATAPIAVASGAFASQAHETTGKATVVKAADGTRVLTLTNFSTAPGPDLRVFLAPGKGAGTDGALDLGRLKGNKGNQQYTIPDGAATGAVIIWCRAFTVAFGTATLT